MLQAARRGTEGGDGGGGGGDGGGLLGSDGFAMDPAPKFVLGMATSLLSSALYAAGLNLIQRDAISNAQQPPHLRRKAWRRPLWVLGTAMFIGSQVVGQTIAIYLLPPLFVAPLGAVTLIFNFLIARFLVGTRITRKDTLGTVIVVCSVVCIVLLGNLKDDDDLNFGSPPLWQLQHLYSRPIFVFYFLIVDTVTLLSLLLAFHSKRALSNELRHRNSRIWKGINRRRMGKGVGVCFASVGGLLASQTLLLGNSGVSLLLRTANGDNQFNQGTLLPHAIVFFLVVTAVLQVVCLNNALQFVDSVIVVPIFYGFYTALGLVNTMIYLDEFDQYRLWVLLLLVLGMLALCYGVRLLSMKKNPPPPPLPTDSFDCASSTITAVDDDDAAFAEGEDVVAFDFVTPDDLGGVIDDEEELDAVRPPEPRGSATIQS